MSSPLLTSSSSTGTLVDTTYDSYIQTPRRKSTSSHGSSVTMITTYPSNEEEFARFPEAVRRKYFSSVERLRLTQKPTGSITPNNDRLHPTSIVSDTRPGSNSSETGCRRLVLRHKKEEARSPQLPPKLVLSESDALWFLRLPDSIKRKYFSKEERNILQRRCQELYPDLSDKSIYLIPPFNRSLTTLNSHSSGSPFDTPDFSRERDIPHFEEQNSYSEYMNRPASRAASMADTMDFASSLALPMQNFDSPKPTPAPSFESKRPFMRRSMSLTKNFRQSRQSFTGFVFTASSTPSTRSHSHSHSLSHDFSSRNSQPLGATPLDHEASYWQDPEARYKLRLYLASPQNFDEAVEFGFPSLTNDEEPPTFTKTTSSKKSEIVETISIISGDTTDENALNTGLRPRPATSGGVEKANSPVKRPMPTTRNSTIGLKEGNTFNPNREMTLRMTLTRKDLRATDDELYGWQSRSSKPFALDAMSTASSTHDAQIGHIAITAGSIKKTNTATKTWKKIWKKVCHV